MPSKNFQKIDVKLTNSLELTSTSLLRDRINILCNLQELFQFPELHGNW